MTISPSLTILLTGSSGKTGRAIIRALSGRNATIRALVRRKTQIDSQKILGADQVVVGDMGDAATLQEALSGIQKVYHICPNVSPDEVAIAKTLLAEAKSAGVEHLVYHSVLHPQIEAMPHHWQKMRVEEMIFASDIPFTILQPGAYMQNILAHRSQILGDHLYPVPYRPEARLTLVDLADVAETAAKVLTESGHEGAIYELCGPQTLSQTDIAAILSEHLGKIVQARQVSLAQWEKNARELGLGDYQIDALLKMFQYYDGHGFIGNSRVLESLLERPAAALASFLNREFPVAAD